MTSQRRQAIYEWIVVFLGLGLIVFLNRRLLHTNSTTVALVLLLYILLLAAQLRRHYAVVVSVVAAAAYNFYFLPPIGTFTIVDPQNWLALFAFLATAVIGSSLSQRARQETREARARQREVEALLALSRDLLLIESFGKLVNQVPVLARSASGAGDALLYLLEGDRVYLDGYASDRKVDSSSLRFLALSLVQVQITKANGTTIPLTVGARPRGLLKLSSSQLSIESNQALGSLISIALDRALALEEVSRNKASRENDRLRTLMLDSVTHELRTPLTAIKGASTSLLSLEEIATADLHELASIIDEEADRLDRLVGRAVEMAQIESGEVHMHIEMADIGNLVRESLDNCSWVRNTHPISVDIPDLPTVAIDVEMIAKVLCNLLENAAKYSEPTAPIFITAEQRDHRVLISIADQGVGIEEDEQELVFDRLYRSRAIGGRVQGSGMGLSISRAIIQNHHGSLTVTSQLGHGSVFTVSLPT